MHTEDSCNKCYWYWEEKCHHVYYHKEKFRPCGYYEETPKKEEPDEWEEYQQTWN